MRLPLIVFLLTLVACGPAVGEVRVHTRPEKPATCELQMVEVSAADMGPDGKFGPTGEMEMIGSVMIGAKEGTDAMADEIKALVRPRACAMGGDAISLLASGTGSNRKGFGQQNIVFTVWGKRAAKAAAPQKF